MRHSPHAAERWRRPAIAPSSVSGSPGGAARREGDLRRRAGCACLSSSRVRPRAPWGGGARPGVGPLGRAFARAAPSAAAAQRGVRGAPLLCCGAPPAGLLFVVARVPDGPVLVLVLQGRHSSPVWQKLDAVKFATANLTESEAKPSESLLRPLNL